MAAAAAGVEAQLRDAKAAKAMAGLQIDDVSAGTARALVLMLARSLLTVAACAGAQEEIMETCPPTPPLFLPPGAAG